MLIQKHRKQIAICKTVFLSISVSDHFFNIPVKSHFHSPLTPTKWAIFRTGPRVTQVVLVVITWFLWTPGWWPRTKANLSLEFQPSISFVCPSIHQFQVVVFLCQKMKIHHLSFSNHLSRTPFQLLLSRQSFLLSLKGEENSWVVKLSLSWSPRGTNPPEHLKPTKTKAWCSKGGTCCRL